MSSQRKSFVPCMIHATSSTAEPFVEMDLSIESLWNACSPVRTSTNKSWTVLKDEEEKAEGASTDEQGFFTTYNLNPPQSEGPFNILYLCTICDFSTNKFDSLSYHNKAQHPGKSLVSFKQIKLDSHTILERPIKNESVPQELENTVKDLQPVLAGSSAAEDNGKMLKGNILEKGPEVDNHQDSLMLKDEIRAVSVNGTIIIPEPMSHVMPLLQRPPNLSSTPTIAVPLYNDKYNPTLDSNATLIASFNRFPYPTHTELSSLTAASKHPEEQIKVWFTTQRLKQGITWSPEEVEEARKKMFNGSISIKPSQPVAQKANCYVTEQTSTVSSGSINTCQPVPVTAANQTLILKRSLVTPLLASETKRPVVPQTGNIRESPPPAERLNISSSSVLPERNKSSSASLVASDFKSPVVVPLVPPKEKPPLVPFKERIPVVLHAVLPKERLPLAPIISSNLKRSIVLQQMDSHLSANLLNPKNNVSYFGDDVCMSSASTVMGPHVNRPTIIQTSCVSSAAPSLSSATAPVFECQSLKPSAAPMSTFFRRQNGKGIHNGDAKSWQLDQNTNTHNEFQHTSGEFALMEHPGPIQFPLLERVKGKSPSQMNLLEESFQRNSFPSFKEVDHLMITSRLSREEIESWFLERRELRDDLEQALLNSMGSRKGSVQSQQAQKHAGTFCFTPVESKSMNLLKNIFVQTRWPSPAELRNLEMQKGFVHTDFVHWFRDSRLTQREEMLKEPTGCQAPDTSQQCHQKGHLLTVKTSKPSSPENEDCFTNMLGQHWLDTNSNAGAVGGGTEGCGAWRCDAGGAESCDLMSDTD